MKVLIYTHEFPPFQGGIATSAKKIADIIASKNDLVVCCPSYSLKKKDESSDRSCEDCKNDLVNNTE